MLVIVVREGIIHSWEMRVRARVCVAEIADKTRAENVGVIKELCCKDGWRWLVSL